MSQVARCTGIALLGAAMSRSTTKSKPDSSCMALGDPTGLPGLIARLAPEVDWCRARVTHTVPASKRTMMTAMMTSKMVSETASKASLSLLPDGSGGPVVVLLSPVSMVGATGAGAVGAPVTMQVGSISNGGTQSPCSHSTRLKLTVSATGSVDRSCSTIDSATRSTVSSVQS